MDNELLLAKPSVPLVLSQNSLFGFTVSYITAHYTGGPYYDRNGCLIFRSKQSTQQTNHRLSEAATFNTRIEPATIDVKTMTHPTYNHSVIGGSMHRTL